MPKITYRLTDGTELILDIEEGVSVMRAALENDVPGIIGECGGQAMCATCHVYVSDADGLQPIQDDEDEMLECTAAPRDPDRSRLGCQLKGGVHFETLYVAIPATQV